MRSHATIARCLLDLEVDAAADRVRQVVMCCGAGAIDYLRIDPCTAGGPLHAVLSVSGDALPAILDEVRRCLPGCRCRCRTLPDRRGARGVHG